MSILLAGMFMCFATDMAGSENVAKDKLTLSINARDLLDSRKFRAVTSGNSFWQDSENWRCGPRFGFTLTYSFGNMNKKRDNNRERSEEPDTFEMD